MGPFPHDAPAATISADNPMGTDGFEFVEYAHPKPEELHALFKLMSPNMGFEYDRKAVEYLIETHYKKVSRPFRACQPRDLLQQVKNFCTYKKVAKKMSAEAFDFAVENYFSVM